MNNTSNNKKRLHRTRRVRAKVHGTAARPRLCVTRTLRNISAQVIDDDAGKTLVSAASVRGAKAKNTVEEATAVGKDIAKKCAAKKITAVVFDRAGHKYHGKVKAVADGARDGGLTL